MATLRVLLIAYSYPPDEMVGAFRPAKLVRALLAAGHRVDVITARLQGEPRGLRDQSDRMRVHAVTAFSNPRHWYLAIRAAWRKVTRGKGEVSGGNPVPPPGTMVGGVSLGDGLLTRFKIALISLLWTPDENQGFILSALLCALRMARRDGVDLIYTTAPPFSDHLVGWLFKLLTGKPWVMELRDPWTDNASRPMEARSRLAQQINEWLEKRCLDTADHIVVVSKPVYQTLAGRVVNSEDRLHLILNGIDEIATRPSGGNTQASPFRIAHTGSLYNDPRPFMKVVARVTKKLGLGPDRLQVQFIGGRPSFSAPTVHELAESLDITGVISFSGWIPQEECREVIARSDLLLLLCRGFPTAVPNKLFDYLGARKPILAIVDRDGESSRILAEFDGHYVHDGSDLGSLAHDLEDAILHMRARRELLSDEATLHAWSTARQMQRLIEIIGGQESAGCLATETQTTLDAPARVGL